MDAARRLLRETKKSVISVALAVGYSSPSHFAHRFRRETGLSPSDYRRQVDFSPGNSVESSAVALAHTALGRPLAVTMQLA